MNYLKPVPLSCPHYNTSSPVFEIATHTKKESFIYPNLRSQGHSLLDLSFICLFSPVRILLFF